MAEIMDVMGRQELTDDAGPFTAPAETIEVTQAALGTVGQPIGQVETLTGTVTAVRADGTQVEFQAGDSVYQGDTLESGPEGAIGIVLADQTTFSMAENGSMVLDEMVYDPGTQDGSVSLSVLQGVFTFVSGEIAKTDPDAMTLNTPVATIGIRGTQVALSFDPTDQGGNGLQVVLMEEADGFVGEVVVQNAAGVQILNVADMGTTVASAAAAPSTPVQFDRGDIVAAFGGALKALPESAGGSTYGAEEAAGEETGEEETGEEAAAEEELLDEEVAEEGEGEEEILEEELAEEEILEEEVVEEEGEEEITEDELAESLDEGFETAAGGDTDLGGDVPPPTGGGDDGSGGGDDGLFGGGDDLLGGTGGDTGGGDTDTGGGTDDDDAARLAAEAAARRAAEEEAAAEALRLATADEPELTVGPVSGDEDQDGGIPLDISVLSTDTVGNETLSITISGVPTDARLSAGSYNSDGTWTLTAAQIVGLTLITAENFNGEIQLSVTATSTVSDREDGDSASTFGTIAVSVAAVDDAPVIGGTASDTLTEGDVGDEPLTASGQLTITDPDAGENVFQAQTGTAGTYGSFSVGANGTWTYDLDATAADALTDGQEVTETFDVLSADGTVTTVTVTITGTNDAPVIEGKASDTLTETDVAQQASGQLTITDVDAGENVFQAQTGTAGT